MNTAQITDSINCITANDNQLKKFENLWEVAQGVSYQAYLISDKKTALIDTVEKRFSKNLLETIDQLLGEKSLDYLVINHMEPDHSGTTLQILEKYPKAVVIGNHKTAVFAQGFYDLKIDRVKEVKTGDRLDLGKHQLEFFQTPMAHWPESMVCYETHTNTLFSSDIFGGYKTTGENVFDSDQDQIDEFLDQARAYFATVLGGYTKPTARALKQLSNLQIECIAPAHGLVWKDDPQIIIKLYNNWANYLPDHEDSPGVSVILGSMYGHTMEIGEVVASKLESEGIQVDLLDTSQTSQTDLLNSVWKNQGLIIGSCTYANGVFPPVRWLLDALLERKIKNKYLGIFSSHSWTGGAMRFLQQFAQDSKLELLEPSFETQFKMRAEAEQAAEQLAQKMIAKIK